MKKLIIVLTVALGSLFVTANQAEANTCKRAVHTKEVYRNYHTKTYTDSCQRYISTWATITYATTYVDACGNYSTKHWKSTKWVKNQPCS